MRPVIPAKAGIHVKKASAKGGFIKTLRTEEEEIVEEDCDMLDERATALQGELDEIKTSRETLADDVDPKWRKHYEKLFANKRSVIVVSSGNGVCGGCHMKLPLADDASVMWTALIFASAEPRTTTFSAVALPTSLASVAINKLRQMISPSTVPLSSTSPAAVISPLIWTSSAITVSDIISFSH